MKKGILGLLLLGPASAAAQPKPSRLPARIAVGGTTPNEVGRDRPRNILAKKLDLRVSPDSRLAGTATADDQWHVPAWAKLARPAPPRDKRKVQLAPANLSGGTGIKVKIPI